MILDTDGCSGTDQLMTPFQTELADLVSRYHDMYYSMRTTAHADEIRLVLHQFKIYAISTERLLIYHLGNENAEY